MWWDPQEKSCSRRHPRPMQEDVIRSAPARGVLSPFSLRIAHPCATRAAGSRLSSPFARCAMSLPELVLALALAGGAAVALGHVVTLVTHGVMSQDHRSQ